ncbi:alginate lyase-domain-containing protein [Mycena epipterygia]|nr:alginate lyase-domain-containing protein [Mycena epipterygia]
MESLQFFAAIDACTVEREGRIGYGVVVMEAVPVLFLQNSCGENFLGTNPYTTYAVDFPDPNRIASGNFPPNLSGAEDTIVAWADEMASYGPWTVTNKPVVAPSGDKHDYMSWAPYQWPDCSKVGNKTVLSLADEWKECAYSFRDGQVNPDRNTIQDFESFTNLSDAVLYNSIAAVLQNKSSSVYSQAVVKFIDTWFLDADTSMNPNLNYGQMQGGPGGQVGEYEGVLDLRGFAKIASGILILRKSGNSDWTSDIDTQMVAWCNKYIQWLQTNAIGQGAAKATNNHGTIYVSQMAGLKLIFNDISGAINLTQGYFSGIYQNQVAANGDQPLEASRTRPYHYRNFNLAGMITNARLLTYAAPTSKGWNATANGATIQKTVDFLMTVNPASTGERNVTAELYPNVAAIASVYGDPDGKYVRFLNSSGFPYADDSTFLWDQPLAGGDVRSPSSSNSTSGPGSTSDKSGAVSSRIGLVGHLSSLSLVLLAFGLQFL